MDLHVLIDIGIYNDRWPTPEELEREKACLELHVERYMRKRALHLAKHYGWKIDYVQVETQPGEMTQEHFGHLEEKLEHRKAGA